MIQLKNLTPIQIRFYMDWVHRFFVIPAGRRSRKTLIGIRKIVLHALGHPGKHYFLGAPTRLQAKGIFWDRLKDETKDFRTTLPRESDLIIELINGSMIQVVGLERAQRIEGRPWDGGLITEFADLKPKMWSKHIRPVFSDTKGFCILDGVPEGKGDYYDLALKAAGGALPETLPFLGGYGENGEWVYYHWYSSDVLDEAEIEQAKEDLDERTFRQEYKGSFEGSEGLAYYNFAPENLKILQYEKTLPIHVGMDFNIDPMTATFNHVRGITAEQFGEAYLRNSNTYEMAKHIQDRFPEKNQKGKYPDIIIYPDASGSARDTTAIKNLESDIAILKNAGFKVRANRANPRVRTRVNSFNSMIKTMSGERRYFVDPKQCPYTVNDLNKVETLPDGSLNKDQEKAGIGHISSAEGYMITYLFPIRKGSYQLKT